MDDRLSLFNFHRSDRFSNFHTIGAIASLASINAIAQDNYQLLVGWGRIALTSHRPC
ncbi:MAG: hypothetical protein ACHBN1_16635 [Heteroscytonema crispum UTEX LB 1556]